ncbi:twin-arginine translocase TatA/TatE family subunit [Methylobacterium sp. NEAU 140]|uniref:twin-arginine translocase TatA/TatE family subunit n=1 Tax=Methylobacterium sp. NEAU 140 TaxID=3064945 RepID=UPI0027333F05|nr:twin-arginine translocase TatA/TatE family subunit [Methylobacterium sp. NEAU 140]MDP4025890.1 twin-arginine translocase TatA/TatE family subunit [Methylobacterium sp. NEAU 140]
MGSMSIWHWVVVAVIVMLLFGRGKVSDLMGDVAKGIKAFKKGMAEDETPAQPAQPVAPSEPVRTIPHTAETSPGTAVPASHLPGGERKPV